MLPYVIIPLSAQFLSIVGIPHRVSEDDVYKGYTIPKGAIVLPNLW
jgi:hypothetical protein